MQAREWVFPADSACGHIVEHKEDRATLAKWGNDLRQTYRTIAQTVGIGDLDIHLLMNHAVAGVNAGYITRSKLLSETISGKMTDVVRSRVKRHEERAMAWPLLPARTVLKNVLRLVEDGAAMKSSTMVGATRQRANRTWSEVAAGWKLDVRYCKEGGSNAKPLAQRHRRAGDFS